MDFSASNNALWSVIIQLGVIALTVFAANFMRRRIPFIKSTLMPTAVLSGFLLLLLKNIGFPGINTTTLEMITYHAIAIGFIALSLRVPTVESSDSDGSKAGFKSGAVIVSTYLVQGIIGLIISLGLAYTFMPEMFTAAGILLPMGYGQGPGQANNVGSSYEMLGFTGGRSFAMSIAAAGYLCACIVGVIYVNILMRRNKLKRKHIEELSGSVTVDTFQDKDEIPISESIDKLSVQTALVITVYFAKFLLTWGLTSLLSAVSAGLASTINPLLWGFNFIVGSMLAMLARTCLSRMKKQNIITRQYQNNYLLSRISGLAFDIMIIAGIASINIEDLSGLWIPFILMIVSGGVVTLLYLQWACKKAYKSYYYEGLTSMYGMLTGTISSGILLLRELDPMFNTPAANNLITGSSFAIILGAPMLLLIGLAPKSPLFSFITLGLLIVYLVFLVLIIISKGPKAKNKDSDKRQNEIKG